MQPLVEFTIKGLESNLYPTQICATELPLYSHQVNMLNLWNRKENLMLTTSTGSGKTAATLFPLVKDKGEKEGENAIFIYPTNALVYNQAKSMIKTLSMVKIGDPITKELRSLKIAITPKTTKITDKRLVEPAEADIQLFLVNSETIDLLSEKRTKGERLLEITQMKLKQSFYLTNPDTLYLLLALKYSESLRNIAGLGEISTIIIDEFHSYSGLELANLVYSLRYADELNLKFRKIFLSATPNEELGELLNKLFVLGDVPLKLEEKSTIRQNIANNIKVKMYPQSLDKDIIKNTKDIIITLKENNELTRTTEEEGKKGYIPCVTILNSVINSIELEDQLLAQQIEVTPYRGLMAKEERKLEGDIIIGTSAIEVGIDFDCKHLVMEASDSASFLQRFGRVGRHQQGTAHIMVPQNVINYFSKYKNKEVDRIEFLNEIKNVYPVKDALAWFVSDCYGLVLAKILSTNLINEIANFRYSTEEGINLAKEIETIFLEKLKKDLLLPFGLINLRIITCSKWFEKLLETIYFRNSYPSIKVLDTREKKKRPENYIYEVDLAMLFKRGEPCEIIESKENKPLVLINSYSKYQKITFKSVKKVESGKILINEGTTAVYSIREGKRFTLDKLLENHVFIVIPNIVGDYLDWRTALYPYDDGSTIQKIAFNGDALICKALIDRLNRVKEK